MTCILEFNDHPPKKMKSYQRKFPLALLMLTAVGCASSGGGPTTGVTPAGFLDDGQKQGKEVGGQQVDGCEVVVRPITPPQFGDFDPQTSDDGAAYQLRHVNGAVPLIASASTMQDGQPVTLDLFSLPEGDGAKLYVTGLGAGAATLQYSVDGKVQSIELITVANPTTKVKAIKHASVVTNQLLIFEDVKLPGEGLWFFDGVYAAVLSLRADM